MNAILFAIWLVVGLVLTTIAQSTYSVGLGFAVGYFVIGTGISFLLFKLMVRS
jgi:uncharacterized membrane protein YccF (DUF307 family)